MAVSKPVTERQLKDAFLPMEAEIANMRDDVTELRTEIREIKHIVKGDGNGTPGHGEQIRDNREAITAINKKLDKIGDSVSGMSKTLIISFILFFAGFLWLILTHQVSIVFP